MSKSDEQELTTTPNHIAWWEADRASILRKLETYFAILTSDRRGIVPEIAAVLALDRLDQLHAFDNAPDPLRRLPVNRGEQQ